jgi:DNA-binding transcriptional ArsR family regulator
MAPGDRLIRDPKILRALAHPARLAILERLQERGPATATECADEAGVSPAAASYHMRLLEKYGLVEDAGDGAGRDRPWRSRVEGFAFEVTPASSPAERAAASLLLGQLIQRGDRWTADYLEREGTLPIEWQEGAYVANKTLRLTPAEAKRLQRELDELCARYRRSADPDAEDYKVFLRGFPARVRRR